MFAKGWRRPARRGWLFSASCWLTQDSRWHDHSGRPVPDGRVGDKGLPHRVRLARIIVIVEAGKHPLGLDPFLRRIAEAILLALGQVATGKGCQRSMRLR